MSSADDQFARVKLGPGISGTSQSELSDNDSDFESDVTQKEDDPDEEYAVDGIKYAYWLKKKGNVPAQWYYGILWGGYLKTESEMDIPSQGIAEDDDLEQDQVYQFWSSFNVNEVPAAKLKPGKREPREPASKSLKYPHIFECPTKRMREWLQDTNPRRFIGTYLARRQYIRNKSDRPHLTPVPKRYSDYYALKKEQRRQRKDAAIVAKALAASNAEPSSSRKDKPRSESRSKASTPTSSAPAKPSTEPSGMDMISEVVDPLSPDLSGLSDLNSAAGDEPAGPLPKTTSVPSTSSKRKLEELSSKAKSKKSKSGSSSMPSEIHVAPAPAASNRLNGLGKIKKNTDTSLFYPAPSPPSTVDASTPHFGEPVSGIFDPESPALVPNSSAVDVRPPTPLSAGVALVPPTATPKQLDSTSMKKPEKIKSTAKIPQTTKPQTSRPQSTQSEPTPSLLEQTRVTLARQAAEAKSKADVALAGKVKTPLLTQPEQGSPSASAALPVPESKTDLSSRPRYHQPVKMKFIDEAINPVANPHLPAGPRGASAQPGLSRLPHGGPSASHSPINASAVKPSTNPCQSLAEVNVRAPATVNATPSGAPSATLPSARNIPTQHGLHHGQQSRKSPAWQAQHAQGPSSHTALASPHVGHNAPLPDKQTSFGVSRFSTAPPSGPAIPTGPSRRASSQTAHPNGALGYTPTSFQQAPQAFHPRQPIPAHSTDPRLASPVQPPSQTPLGTVYNSGADPRRRGLGVGQPLLPIQSTPPHPYGNMSPSDFHALPSPRSPVSDSRKPSHGGAQPVEQICEFRADIQLAPDKDVRFRFGLLKGSTVRRAESLNLTQFFLHSPHPDPIHVAMEEVDDICLTGILNLGGQVVEWSRPSLVQDQPNANNASKKEYGILKDRVATERRAFVSYTERVPEGGVSNHYAIVLASPDAVDLCHIGLGCWTKETINVGLFVVALPLTSVPVPRLPNPVRPALDIPSNLSVSKCPATVPVLDSYGLNDAFLNSLSGTTVMKYPGEDGPTDVLHGILSAKLKAVNAIPATEVDTLLVLNQKFGRTLKSSSIRANLHRRTAIYAYGPSIQLYPSQWGLTPIWLKGGLATFSPTFILRNPAAFLDIMRMIRTVETWAAYVLPGVIQWCQDSWDKPPRCPEPAKAFDALTRSLFLDQHILPLSGAFSSSNGGLAVSCAPPVIHNADGCRKWMEWLRKITEEKSFKKLAEHCHGVTARDFAAVTAGAMPAIVEKATTLELIDIERAQIDDMIAMRARPHLLPYRRYIYIGGTSLAEDVRARIREIEFVSPGDFDAVLSGAL